MKNEAALRRDVKDRKKRFFLHYPDDVRNEATLTIGAAFQRSRDRRVYVEK